MNRLTRLAAATAAAALTLGLAAPGTHAEDAPPALPVAARLGCRSVVVDGIDARRTTGPGRLCRELEIDRSWNGREAELYDDGHVPPRPHLVTPRIGITKAADWPRRWLAG